MVDRVRIAVIGTGSMGANHARVLAELPDAELVAVADADESRARAAAHGAQTYRDDRALLGDEQLDAVTIAVPTRLHLEAGLACIERGVAVLMEKPIGADVDEGERLREAAESRGVALMVGHVERFNPALQELKRRLDAGELGRVLELRARRVGPFFERERDVGVVQDLATHDIDVFRYLLGCEVEQAQAETIRGIRTEFEDALTGTLRFENGAVGALDVNWLTPIKVREIAVLGERGLFVADELRQELRFFESAEAAAEAQAVLVSFPGAGEAPLRAELAAFLRVARGEAPPPVSAADGIAALRVAEALLESARRGEAVRLAAGGLAR